MIITVLDSVVSGRFVPDDELPVGRLKIAERALKTAALLGYRIDLGRPHLIDHTYILTQADKDEGFLDFLKYCRFTHHFFKEKSIAVAAGSAMMNPDYYASAWCFDDVDHRIDFAELVRAEKWTEAVRKFGHQSIEAKMANGLHRLNDWLKHPGHVYPEPKVNQCTNGELIDSAWERSAQIPNEDHRLPRRIAEKMTRLAGVTEGLYGELPANLDIDATRIALNRLDFVQGKLSGDGGKKLNDRSAWVKQLCDITGDTINPPADLPEALAIQLVQHAYHEVLGKSWGTDGFWVSDGYPANDLAEEAIPLIQALYPSAVHPEAQAEWAADGLRCRYYEKGDSPHEKPRLLDDLSWSQIVEFLQSDEIRHKQHASISARRAFSKKLVNLRKTQQTFDKERLKDEATAVHHAHTELQTLLSQAIGLKIISQADDQTESLLGQYKQSILGFCGTLAGGASAIIATGLADGEPLGDSMAGELGIVALSAAVVGLASSVVGPKIMDSPVGKRVGKKVKTLATDHRHTPNFIEGKLIWEFQDGFPIF